jgi:hypothetical protein
MNEKIEHENLIAVRVRQAIEAASEAGIPDEAAVVAFCAPFVTGRGKRGRAAVYGAVRHRNGLTTPVAPPDKGQMVKSKRGTWARQIGNRASALTLTECEAKQLIPGPGNF